MYVTFVLSQFVFLTICVIILRRQDKQHISVDLMKNSPYVVRSGGESASGRGESAANRMDHNLRHFMDSKWVEYRDSWKGEELVSIEKTEKLIFSKQYKQTMVNKGLHLLTETIPEFADRYRLIESYCKFPRNNEKERSLIITGRRLMFVDRYEVLGCNIPKASSTTFTHIFMKLDQGILEDEQKLGPSGHKLNISMVNIMDDHYMNAKRIQTYLKVALTRHPFSWISSKYHFKAANSANKEFQAEVCPDIIRRLYLEGMPTNEEDFIKSRRSKFGHMYGDKFEEILVQIRRYNAGPGYYNITLLEYINAMLLKPKNSFEGQVRLCNPCAMHFDIILHTTNGYEEVNKVLDFLQKDKPYEKRIHYPKGSPLVSKAKCNEEFAAISMETRQKLYTYLEQDFLLFGYKFENDPNSLDACY